MLCGAVLAGCNRPEGLAATAGQPVGPAGRITIAELARRRLRVVRRSRFEAALQGNANAVDVFADPHGGVFVNGKRLDCPVEVLAAGGELYLPQGLVGRIRARLRAPSPARRARPPTPPRPVGLVVLDPGHGGRDPGAIAWDGRLEKDVVLAVALELRGELLRRHVRVAMTRRDDRFIPLEERAEVANRLGADLFVSVHADSAHNARARGHTLYVARRADARTVSAARELQRSLAGCAGASRGLRRANYRVLVRTTCPAMLVELGFLSNPQEARRLGTARYQRQLAGAMAEGILAALRASALARATRQ